MRRFRPLALFNVTFLLCFALLALAVGLSPTVDKFGLFQPVLIIFSLASFLAASSMMAISIRPAPQLIRYYPYLMALGLAVACFIQLAVAYALTSRGYDWDSQHILDAAGYFGLHQHTDPIFLPYLRDNPNNIGLYTILSLLFVGLHRLGFHDFLVPVVMLNAVVLFAAQAVTVYVAYLLYGRRIAAISLLFCVVLIGLSMYVQIPYTDTLTIFFPVSLLLLVLLFIRASQWRVRMVLAAVTSILAVTGSLVKPTVIIALVAIMIIGTIWVCMAKTWQTFGHRLGWSAIYLGWAFVIALGVYTGFSRLVDSSHLLPYPYAKAGTYGKPPDLFMAMGMRTTIDGYSVNYGGYSKTLTESLVRIQSPVAKRQFADEAIATQLRTFTPLSYLQFLGNKLKWIMSDATFFAYGEGSNAHVVFVHTDTLSRMIQSFMFPGTSRYLVFGDTLQVFWLALLLLISAQLFFVLTSKSARYNGYASILRLMLCGITIFLLFFEGRSRYIFLYLPIFILLAMYTLRWLKERDQPVEKPAP